MKPKNKGHSTITNKKKSQKGTTPITQKIQGLSNLNKNQLEVISQSSTSRNFLKDSNRTQLSNALQEKSRELISTRELKSIKFKIMAKQEEFSINLTDEIGEMTVRDFKEKYLEEHLDDGQFGARLIWNGRELRNSHQIKEFGLEDNPIVYVFLFNIQDREFETRKITTLKTDPNLGVDFDYFVERNALSEEEVAWKRFCYHGPYIFRAKLSKISDYYLFMREIDFMNANKQLKKNKGDFKGLKLNEVPEFERHISKGREITIYIVLFLVSILIGPFSLPLIKLSLSQKMRYTIILGNLLYLIILLISKFIFSLDIFSPIQIPFH